ncbi:hypothetical protein C8255_16975 [filamentous cyanobacterium CCP3]|nr:hypothetical protein C8255_16975 [filamentous cyanobacterium CCP3]
MVFTYSLPSKASSSPRVTLWRRLKRLGAIALNGVQVLPDRDDCLESFQWLVQEVRQAQGDALVMRVESFFDMGEQSIVQRFREARRDDYADLGAKVAELEKALTALGEASNALNDSDRRHAHLLDALEKLHKHYADIRQIDFFDCPDQDIIATRLKHLTQALIPPGPEVMVAPKAINAYQTVRWLTRPRPHVDRLACIWLIRRFINSAAVIRYDTVAEAGEVAFDMPEGEFQHQGNLCTFEVMVKSFGLEDAPLRILGEIVHEIDLRDGKYLHPQTSGIDALLRGWLLASFTDLELETYGIALFEGLYNDCSKRTA